MKILGISGSLRADAFNTALLEYAARRLPTGSAFSRFQTLAEIPPFDQDLEAGVPPAAVAAFKAALAAADAVVIATPEYNASVPGVLKNALDWASRPYETNPLRGKPVLVIGASAGAFGATEAQSDLRRILARIGARVIQGDLPVGKAAAIFEPSMPQLPDPLEEKLKTLIAALVAEADLNDAVTGRVAA